MDWPETQTKSLPGNFKDMHFATGDEFYRIAQNEAVENHFLYEVSEDSYSDENVRDAAQKYIDDTDRMYSGKIAECKVSFNGHTGDEANSGNRNSETNIGDLVADAFIWYIRHQGTVTGVPDRNVIAIMNGAGIRKAIPEGDITRKDIWGALPYSSTLSAVRVKGNQLLEALEVSTFSLPAMVNGFPQVSGIEFTVNTAAEYDAVKETYPGSTYYGPADIRRVTIDSVNGEAFDPEADYMLLLPSFLADGGDTYYVLTEASERIDTGITIQYAVTEYIMDALDGLIDESYSEPKGRIHILK